MQPLWKSHSLPSEAFSDASTHDSLVSLSSSPKKSSSTVCHICLKKLSVLTRQRHHCRVCGNSVCANDSEKRYVQDKLIRTCSKCVEEAKKKEVQQQLLAKVKVVKDKCEEVKAQIKQDTELASDATSKLKNIKYSIEKAEYDHSSRIALDAFKIEEEEQRGKKLRETLENLQAMIDETNKRERLAYNRTTENDSAITKCRNDIQEAKNESAEIMTQIELLEPRVSIGISLTEAAKVMCNICQKRMEFSLLNPEMASIIEECSFNTSRSSDPIVMHTNMRRY
mmetsp:Transcript_20005/g.37168  ORF Transcript_20005/g.37168 Transcript_20005/m.37168 type:complete len:282 (-) Transcript_20005:21-866(-)